MTLEEFKKIARAADKAEQVGDSFFAYGAHTVCSDILKNLPCGQVDYSPRYETWFVTNYTE